MALEKCPDCGTDISTGALVCPKCGRPISPVTESTTNTERTPCPDGSGKDKDWKDVSDIDRETKKTDSLGDKPHGKTYPLIWIIAAIFAVAVIRAIFSGSNQPSIPDSPQQASDQSTFMNHMQCIDNCMTKFLNEPRIASMCLQTCDATYPLPMPEGGYNSRSDSSAHRHAQQAACSSQCVSQWTSCNRACRMNYDMNDADLLKDRFCSENCDEEKSICELECKQ
jgi:hypothetical protein